MEYIFAYFNDDNCSINFHNENNESYFGKPYNIDQDCTEFESNKIYSKLQIHSDLKLTYFCSINSTNRLICLSNNIQINCINPLVIKRNKLSPMCITNLVFNSFGTILEIKWDEYVSKIGVAILLYAQNMCQKMLLRNCFECDSIMPDILILYNLCYEREEIDISVTDLIIDDLKPDTDYEIHFLAIRSQDTASLVKTYSFRTTCYIHHPTSIKYMKLNLFYSKISWDHNGYVSTKCHIKNYQVNIKKWNINLFTLKDITKYTLVHALLNCTLYHIEVTAFSKESKSKIEQVFIFNNKVIRNLNVSLMRKSNLEIFLLFYDIDYIKCSLNYGITILNTKNNKQWHDTANSNSTVIRLNQINVMYKIFIYLTNEKFKKIENGPTAEFSYYSGEDNELIGNWEYPYIIETNSILFNWNIEQINAPVTFMYIIKLNNKNNCFNTIIYECQNCHSYYSFKRLPMKIRNEIDKMKECNKYSFNHIFYSYKRLNFTYEFTMNEEIDVEEDISFNFYVVNLLGIHESKTIRTLTYNVDDSDEKVINGYIILIAILILCCSLSLYALLMLFDKKKINKQEILNKLAKSNYLKKLNKEPINNYKKKINAKGDEPKLLDKPVVKRPRIWHSTTI